MWPVLRFGLLLLLAMGMGMQAAAQPAADPVAAALTRAQYQASATQAAIERALDTRLLEQRRRVESLERELRIARTQGATAEVQAASVRAALISEQQRIVEQLAQRDRGYAAEMAAFRRELSSLVELPEGRAALERYNAGDRAGGIAAADRMAAAFAVAARARADIEAAASLRWAAALALDAYGRGEVRTDEMVQRFERITQLDPGRGRDWVTLAELRSASGDTARALQAALRAQQTAEDDRGRAMALEVTARLHEDLGQVEASRKEMEAAVAAFGAAASASADALASRDLGVAVLNSGLLLERAGDTKGAQHMLQRALIVAGLEPSANEPESLFEIRQTALSALARIRSQEGDAPAAARELEGVVKSWRTALSERQPPTPAARRSLAAALLDAASAQVSLGRFSQAGKFNKEALSLLEDIAGVDETLAWARADLAVALARAAQSLFIAGNTEEGERIARKAAQIQLALFEQDRGVLRRLEGRITSQLRVGDALLTQKKTAEAKLQYQEALDVLNAVAPLERPQPNVVRRLRVDAELALGNAELQSGRPAAARAHFELSMAANGRGPALELGAARMEVRLLGLLAAARVAEGDDRSALVAYADAVATAEALLQRAPESVGVISDLSLRLGEFGDLLLRRGEAARAREMQERSLFLLRDLAARDRATPGLQMLLSVRLNKLVDALTAEGKLAAAEERHLESLHIVQSAARDLPGSSPLARDWALGYSKLAELRRRQGRLDLAVADFRRALELLDRVSGDAAATAQRDRSILAYRLGEALRGAGMADEAAVQFRASLALRRELAAAQPSTPSLQREVSAPLWRLAELGRVPWNEVVLELERLDDLGLLRAEERERLVRARNAAAAQSIAPR